MSMTHPAVQRTRALDRLMTDGPQIGKAVATWPRRVARNRDHKYTDAHPVTDAAGWDPLPGSSTYRSHRPCSVVGHCRDLKLDKGLDTERPSEIGC